MTTSPEEQQPAKPRTALRTAMLAACLLVAGAFAVWQVGLFLHTPHAQPSRPTTMPTTLPAASQIPSAGVDNSSKPSPTDLVERFQKPLTMDGLRLQPIQTPPPVVALPGAKLLWSFRRNAQQEGFIDSQWVYQAEVQPGQVGRHYREKLLKMGYLPVTRPAGSKARQAWIFYKKPQRLTVSLRNDPKNAKMVRVVLTVTTPVRTREQGPDK